MKLCSVKIENTDMWKDKMGNDLFTRKLSNILPPPFTKMVYTDGLEDMSKRFEFCKER